MEKESLKHKKLLSYLFLFGLFVSIYLVYLHFKPSASTICQINEFLDCDKVNKSIYAKIFGIPVSILGLLYYIFAFISCLYLKSKFNLKLFLLLFVSTLGGALFSLYLTYVEFFILYALCIFCFVHQINILILSKLLYDTYKVNKT